MKRRILFILILVSIAIALAWYIDQTSYAGDAFRADLHGKVVDMKGRPVEGIEVFYVRYHGTGILARTVTQRDGSFTFPALDASSLFPADPGCFVAHRKGEYIGWRVGPEWDKELPVSIGNRPFHITVTAPVADEVAVVDTHGKPMPGLAVSVRSIYKDQQYIGLNAIRPFIDPVTLTTDAAGRVKIAGVAGGCDISYDVSSPGFAAIKELSLGDKMVVSRTGKIAGRVCLESGKPIAEVEVSCESSQTVTGADGSYELAVLPGKHNVTASSDYFGSKPFYDVAVVAGRTTRRNLIIHCGTYSPPVRPRGSVTLSGVVVDELSRRPVPFVSFSTTTVETSDTSLDHDEYYPNSVVNTDSRGRFKTSVTPGSIDVDGFCPHNPYYSEVRSRSEYVNAKGKNVTGITLYAKRAHIVRGCVRDDRAKPVAGATVFASNTKAVTDSEGNFVLAAWRYNKQEGLFKVIGKAISSKPEPGSRHQEHVLAIDEDRKLSGYRRFDHGLPGSGLCIVVRPDIQLAVQVRDASGRPVRNAHVGCVSDPSWLDGPGEQTDSMGEARLSPLISGASYKLICRAEGYDDIELDLPTAGSKNWSDRKQVTLKPMSRVITGVVLDKAGNPTAGAEIRIVSCERVVATTGSNGRFLFKTEESGVFYIRAAKGDVYGEGYVEAGQNDVSIKLGTHL